VTLRGAATRQQLIDPASTRANGQEAPARRRSPRERQSTKSTSLEETKRSTYTTTRYEQMLASCDPAPVIRQHDGAAPGPPA
jgi:hypothetical protein